MKSLLLKFRSGNLERLEVSSIKIPIPWADDGRDMAINVRLSFFEKRWFLDFSLYMFSQISRKNTFLTCVSHFFFIF